jgi:hypothetical protein
MNNSDEIFMRVLASRVLYRLKLHVFHSTNIVTCLLFFVNNSLAIYFKLFFEKIEGSNGLRC